MIISTILRKWSSPLGNQTNSRRYHITALKFQVLETTSCIYRSANQITEKIVNVKHLINEKIHLSQEI